MKKKEQQNMAEYFSSTKVFNNLPPFYKKLEMYMDDMASDYDVPDLNIVPSDFHQTDRYTSGYCFKRSGYIVLDETKFIQKQGS